MDVDAERRTGLARQSLAIVYAILCHGLFVAGVGMMIFQMYSGMSRSFGRLDWPWSSNRIGSNSGFSRFSCRPDRIGNWRGTISACSSARVAVRE